MRSKCSPACSTGMRPLPDLNTTLVRTEKIANSVGAGYDSTQRGPGMFMVSGVPSAGKTVGELEQALRRELMKIVTGGITGDELKRVKSQVVSAQVFQRDSIYFQASQIGSLEIAGYPHAAMDRMIEKLREVTPEQVQAVAKKYLVDDSLTIAVPRSAAPRRPQALDRRRRAAMCDNVKRWLCALVPCMGGGARVVAAADSAVADKKRRPRLLRRDARFTDARRQRRFPRRVGIRHT